MKRDRTVSANRDRFIDVAFSLFLRKGFADTSMSEIAREAGGSLATIYKYFGSKDALFAVVLQAKSSATYERFGTLAKLLKNESIEESLHRFGLMILDLTLTEESAMAIRLMVGEGHKDNGKLSRIFFEHGYGSPIKILRDFIAEKQEMGIFRPCDPFLAAGRFFWLVKEPRHFIFLISGEKPIISLDERKAIVCEATEFFLRAIAIDNKGS
ncbi:hypothetical protein AGMMS50229_15380 [Campylobacterota bacterium]|nr:hypothetical protein AGMMS50229_15380 [Campylobacterota bacterium]